MSSFAKFLTIHPPSIKIKPHSKMYTCPKCEGKTIKTDMRQTRCCDEGPTITHLCLTCHYHWV